MNTVSLSDDEVWLIIEALAAKDQRIVYDEKRKRLHDSLYRWMRDKD